MSDRRTRSGGGRSARRRSGTGWTVGGDRGLSTVTSYVVTLGIVALLGTGLFLTTYEVVQDERGRAIRAEFDVTGNRLAGGIATVDRLTVTDGRATTERARLRLDLPERAGGTSYLLTVGNRTADGRHRITLNSTYPEVTRTVWVKTSVPVEPTTVEGGPVALVYNRTSGSLEVRNVD